MVLPVLIVPMLPGMGVHGADCGPATMAGPMCVALLAAAVFAAVLAIGRRASVVRSAREAEGTG